MESLHLLLVLEDNELSNEAALRLQGMTDVKVEPTVPEEAVEQIKGGQYDAVICGMNLKSDEDGLMILAAVRQLDQLMPFFFFTRDDSPQLIAQAFQEGAHDYFVVGERRQQLEQVIEAVRVNVDLARLLRAQQSGRMRTSFEEKYAGLFEELEEGSMMIDTSRGTISFVNDSMVHSLGYESHEMVGRTLEEFLGRSFGAEAVPTLPELLQQIESGEGVLEVGFLHREGHSLHFWVMARVLELGGSEMMLLQCRDITRFEQLEREVIAVRNQLRTIVENSADAIIVSRADGMIEFFGGAAPQLFGISADEATGRSIDDLFGAHSHEVRSMLDQVGDRQRVSGMESSIVSRWGTRVPVSVAITVLPSSDGITRHLFNILDITSQKVGEAEKLLSAELIRIVSTGAGPVEALPKLIDRVRSKVPIDYALVVAVDSERDALSIEALYCESGSGGELRLGQSLGIENQPVEEELWLREGIVRNDLKLENLAPLERLLYGEGVRSYVSVPLPEQQRVIGGAHFGSVRPYALNRGHLTLFMDLAGALAGALVRARSSGEAQRFRLFTSAMVEEAPYPLMICDPDGTVLEANEKAREILGTETELRGRSVLIVLRNFFKSLVPDIAWLRKNAGTQRPCTSRDGERWMVGVSEYGSRSAPAGYAIRLQQA